MYGKILGRHQQNRKVSTLIGGSYKVPRNLSRTAELGKAGSNLGASRHLCLRSLAFAIMGALIYGDHHLFFPQAFSQQKYINQYISHTILGPSIQFVRKIEIHCKVPAYWEALLYSCTKIKYTFHVMCYFGEALHTIARREVDAHQSCYELLSFPILFFVHDRALLYMFSIIT